MCIFFSVTEVYDGSTCQVVIQNAETDVIVVAVEVPLPKDKKTGPRIIYDMAFQLQNVTFPEPGAYYLMLMGNGEMLLQRPFEVTLVKGEEKHDEPTDN